jgi:hypothetical protein
MNEKQEELDKYFGEETVKKVLKSSVFDKKRTGVFEVSDRESAEGIYFWDPVLRHFIKFVG